MVYLFLHNASKKNQIFGIRTIIEAIKAKNTIDKVFLQKGLSGELYTELEKLLRKQNINFSYVPVEKLNRLTPHNHQGAVATMSPIAFYDLEELISAVKEIKEHPTAVLPL